MIRLWCLKGSHPKEKSDPSNLSTLGLIALETADQLLQTPHRHTLLQKISRLISLPQPHFSHFVQPLLHNYARFVQRLPASEVHHHAGLGGMLDHGLEVTARALQIRRGHLLPQGAEPEIIAKKQDLWSYATLTGALLHDIGKPAVDQRITLYNARGKSLGPWDPWVGPMDLVNDCVGYRVEFVRERQYRLHERVAPLLAHHIVPPCGQSWLASDPEVLTTWLGAITGDHENAGILGQIIGQADWESVAQNLGAGDEVRLPTTGVKPLHEKLLTSLRYLLSEGELPLNRNGAAGWLVGNDLWLVSKRTVDALRSHLTAEGHSGIPNSNDRLFDVLQEQGMLIPCGDRAIWRLEVSRHTVRKARRGEEPPRYQRQVVRVSKLDPYKDYLQARVEAAKPEWLPATALYREITEQGYRGELSILRDWLRRLKPRMQPEPVVRFETAPGEQLQIDWIVFRRGRDRLSAFVATLGYSRSSYVEFVTDERLETLLTLYCLSRKWTLGLSGIVHSYEGERYVQQDP